MKSRIVKSLKCYILKTSTPFHANGISVFVVAVWEGCLLVGELFTLTGLFLKIFFSHIFAGYNNIINFLLPARLRILKGIFFPLNIPQDIDITAAYNISLASMLREMR